MTVPPSVATSPAPARGRWVTLPSIIAVLALVSIAAHLLLRFWLSPGAAEVPLWVGLALGGTPLVAQLLVKLARRDFGSDLLAGISIVTSVMLGEYLAGVLVVLMLSGGETLEAWAVRSASSALAALSRRMPAFAQRRTATGDVEIPLGDVQVGDSILILPHATCPVDGTVLEGRSLVDEAYLTGESSWIRKRPGSTVISGTTNGDGMLVVRADARAADSRFAQIMRVMEASQQRRPRLRRLGDQLGAVYTPLAVGMALGAWGLSGDPLRFLAVLVVATPCPLLIGIPVAIIGSISLAAQRSIIIRNPAVLEMADRCRTIIFDKTGTLTYGKPVLVRSHVEAEWNAHHVLTWVSNLERYSRHPLAPALVAAGSKAGCPERAVEEVVERPGRGLHGRVDGRDVRVTSRSQLLREDPAAGSRLPPPSTGLECVVTIDGRLAATYQFRDVPRSDGATFANHLRPRHRFERIMLVSGDRDSEVRYLAEELGIVHVRSEQTPEQKLAIAIEETGRAKTIFVGDGINDAPALLASTIGIAFGPQSDVTSEAADAVVIDTDLGKVDEFLHIGRRMRRIALQTAVGGMALSAVGMIVAAAGYLPPVSGALLQELIDVAAVGNALRAAWPPRSLTDFARTPAVDGAEKKTSELSLHRSVSA